MSTGSALCGERIQAGERSNHFGTPVGEADQMPDIYADFFSAGQNSITFPRC